MCAEAELAQRARTGLQLVQRRVRRHKERLNLLKAPLGEGRGGGGGTSLCTSLSSVNHFGSTWIHMADTEEPKHTPGATNAHTEIYFSFEWFNRLMYLLIYSCRRHIYPC